jgi:hypothetical protein
MGYNNWRLFEANPQNLVEAPNLINVLQYVTV